MNIDCVIRLTLDGAVPVNSASWNSTLVSHCGVKHSRKLKVLFDVIRLT